MPKLEKWHQWIRQTIFLSRSLQCYEQLRSCAGLSSAQSSTIYILYSISPFLFRSSAMSFKGIFLFLPPLELLYMSEPIKHILKSFELSGGNCLRKSQALSGLYKQMAFFLDTAGQFHRLYFILFISSPKTCPQRVWKLWSLFGTWW